MSDRADDPTPPRAGRSPRIDREGRLGLVVAGCLLAEAVVAKNVLEVELDPFSQFAAMWAYLHTCWPGPAIAPRRRRSRSRRSALRPPCSSCYAV